jgi:hypothetical protein
MVAFLLNLLYQPVMNQPFSEDRSGTTWIIEAVCINCNKRFSSVRAVSYFCISSYWGADISNCVVIFTCQFVKIKRLSELVDDF